VKDKDALVEVATEVIPVESQKIALWRLVEDIEIGRGSLTKR